MSADPDPGAEPVQAQAGAGGTPHVDARRAVGVQVGQDNTQIIYNYAKLTWTDGVGPPPLVAVSGKVDSPYRGLRAFEERDAPFFFGREAAVTDVLKRMSRCVDGTGLLVVSGVSGAGKSSLLRAGVLPRIRGLGLAAAPEAARWPCLLLTPGPTPLDVLAVQVAHLAGVDAAAVRRGLDDDPARFALTARQAALAQLGGPPGDPGSSPPGPPREQRLLLMVDQFEQVFTQCSDEKQRQVFITALCATAARDGLEQDPAALIVLGVRADFEARCADYPQLADAIQDRYLVTSMTERQLRMAITEPAKRVASSVDEDLVDVLLEEVSTRQPASSPAVPGRGSVSGAGILPLLSHALDKAWRSRAGDVLTLADYERTGGIEGAVADSAQHAYDCLTPAQQAAARRVFTRLTATTSESVDISDRASRAELTEGKDAAQARDVEAVLEAFASERLLTLAAGTVEISHEVLLTAWPLLRDTWLAETHAERIVRTRLHNAAADWERRSRDPSYLYSGSLLEDAAVTAARISADPVRYPSLSQTERDFIRASERARRRRVRRREVIMAFLMVLVVGFASAAFLAVRAGQETASERDAAVSELLASQSEAMGDADPVLSKMLSVAAYRIHPSDQATYAMLAAGALPGVNRLPAGSNWAYTVAFSPQGKTLASGNYDGTIRLWNAATGQQIGKTLNDSRAGEVLSVAFSPDGKTLASGNQNGTIQLWNVASGQQIRPPLNGHAGKVNSVAFSHDGTTLASGSDNAVQLWNAATGQLTENYSVASNIGPVNAVAFSPDGQTLASGNQNGTILLWNAATGQLTENYSVASNNGPVNSVAFSPDGQTLASGSNGEVQLWNAATGQPTGTLQTGDVKSVNSVAFSPDGSTLASGSDDQTVRLWDTATGQQIGPSLTGHTGWVESVAFSPDGSTLASSSNDQTVRLWNVAIAKPMGNLASDGAAPVHSVAFSPNGKILADGNGGGTVRLLAAPTGKQIASLAAPGAGAVNSIACSPDGKTLASGYANGTIRLWDVLNGQPIGNPLTGGAGAVNSVAFSLDGKTLASGYANGTIRLWDVATGQPIGKTLNGHAGPVYSVAFSPGGQTLASGDFDNTVQLWDVGTGRQIHAPLTGHTYAVQSVAFSSQDMLASGSIDYTIRLWNPASGHLLPQSPLTGDTGFVNSVAFSPDGQTLASGAADGTVRLWDVATGQQIGASFTGQTGPVNSVAFSPDGKTLASGDANGTVQLWDVAYVHDIMPDLCASAGRSLTRAQWAPYAPDLAYQNICP